MAISGAYDLKDTITYNGTNLGIPLDTYVQERSGVRVATSNTTDKEFLAKNSSFCAMMWTCLLRKPIANPIRDPVRYFFVVLSS